MSQHQESVPNQKGDMNMMSRLSSVVKRHPIITFFVLTYALAWAIESPLVFLTDSLTGTQSLALVILASNVPSAVAIVLTAMVFGRGALRKLLGRLLIWRVNPIWYLVVFLGPAALVAGVVGLNALMGGPALSLGMPLLGAAIFFGFSIFPGSALGEEIGWRGYVLPRLQSRMSALSVILTWVYNSTGGSLLFVVLLHATVNLPQTLTIDEFGSRATVPLLLYWGLMVVAAIVVVVVAGPKHLSRKHRKQEEEEGATESGVATPPGVVK